MVSASTEPLCVAAECSAETLEEGIKMAEDVLCLTLCHLEEDGAEIPKATDTSSLALKSDDSVLRIACDTLDHRKGKAQAGDGTKPEIVYTYTRSRLAVIGTRLDKFRPDAFKCIEADHTDSPNLQESDPDRYFAELPEPCRSQEPHR